MSNQVHATSKDHGSSEAVDPGVLASRRKHLAPFLLQDAWEASSDSESGNGGVVGYLAAVGGRQVTALGSTCQQTFPDNIKTRAQVGSASRSARAAEPPSDRSLMGAVAAMRYQSPRILGSILVGRGYTTSATLRSRSGYFEAPWLGSASATTALDFAESLQLHRTTAHPIADSGSCRAKMRCSDLSLPTAAFCGSASVSGDRGPGGAKTLV